MDILSYLDRDKCLGYRMKAWDSSLELMSNRSMSMCPGFGQDRVNIHQIAMWWGLAQAYRALFNTVQCSKGEGGANKATGTAAFPAPPTNSAAAPAGTADAAAPQPAMWLMLPQLLQLPHFPMWTWWLLQLWQQAPQLRPETNLWP